MTTQTYEVVIVGAGQCGIACASGLKTFGITDFVVLEKGDTINNFWKNHTYDRMSLHTPYHDIPYDGGLVFEYPAMKDKHEFTEYLQRYASKYDIHRHIHYHTQVVEIDREHADHAQLWILRTQHGTVYRARYLCLATSSLCAPRIPQQLQRSMHKFQSGNGVVHSVHYKNGAKYKHENVLIIGNGNSAFEIATDLVAHDARKVTLLSRSGRHVVRLQDLNRSSFWFASWAKKFGLLDLFQSRTFHITQKHPKWNVKALVAMHGDFDRLSVDLTRYGLPRPARDVFRENLSGNLAVFDWERQHSCVQLIRQQRVQYICDEVLGFDAPTVVHLKRSQQPLTEYDAVILCTGFAHGLGSLFVRQLFEEYFEESPLGKRHGIVPKTNGFNQSSVDDSLFFVGLLGDYSMIGGLANGYWGWQCARTIAKQQRVYDAGNEPSIWNAYTLKRMCLLLASVSGVVLGCTYYGYKKYGQCVADYIHSHVRTLL